MDAGITVLLWWRWQGDGSLWRDLLRSLPQEDRDSGKSCHGQGWAVLMPQVSASAGGDSLSVRERVEKVVLQCHPPICCGVEPRCTVVQLLGVRDVALLSPSSPPFPIEQGMVSHSPSSFVCGSWWQPGGKSPLVRVWELFPSCRGLQRDLDTPAVLP